MTDYNIPREPKPFSRPLLYPPTGDKRVAYSRPSTLGKDIDKGEALVPWEQTMVCIGMAKRPNLFARVQSIVARGGSWATDKKQFKELMEQAKEAARWKDQADRGSAIHDFADAAEQGTLDYSLVPDHLAGPVRWYEENIVPQFKVLATECFVAVDRDVELPRREPIPLRAAGSIDRICEWQGKRYILDIKTGRDDEFRTGVCGQLWLYSRGLMYADDVVDQDEKYPDLNWVDSPDNPSRRAAIDVDQDRAIMLKAPKFARKGEWAWKAYWIPLDKGAEIVECGQWARKARSVKEFEEFKL